MKKMKRKITPLVLSCLSLLLSGACQGKKEAGFQAHSARQTGIDFQNTLSPSPDLNILNYLYFYNGSGIAAGDFNQDGWIDLYFGGNQVDDQLYLNQGDWKFKKVTKASGISDKTGWTSGVNQVDINGDGLLDLYICKVSGYQDLKGHNLLYINRGNDENGVPQFEEMSREYGLNFSGYATHSAFFDMDADGDLDAFLLNHSVHPNRTYGRGDQRLGYDPKSGDRLYENRGGRFIDISTPSGIYQGKTGYGLGLSVGYLNEDHLPEIYVGNDFFENDYFYQNLGEGRFEELLSTQPEILGHTTHFSMGNTIFDLNRDGRFDLLSLDMLPEDLLTYKTSGLEYPYPIYQQYLKRGYHPQYMQNTLHLNLGDQQFSEIAFMSGLAATEWSWGAVAADFDHDGWEDVFISNGIQGATNNMDFINFIANDQIQKRLDAGMQEQDLPLIEEIPAKSTPNYVYKNNGNLSFSNQTSEWLSGENSMSQGAIQADLDNDGDLDLIVSNTNGPVELLENTVAGGNWLQLDLKGPQGNSKGIGTRVKIFADQQEQNRALFPSNAYLSSGSNRLHFGLDSVQHVDSIHLIWPNGRIQRLANLEVNQRIALSYPQTPDWVKPFSSEKAQTALLKLDSLMRQELLEYPPTGAMVFQKIDSLIPFVHIENPTLDFDRSPLIPFAGSNQGPTLAIADLDKNGLEDLFIGGAKAQPSQLYLQRPEGFKAIEHPDFKQKALNEDTAALFFDANNDGWMDLLIGSGGNEFQQGSALKARLYLNENGRLQDQAHAGFPNIELQCSSMEAVDFNQDGLMDVLMTSDGLGGAFGKGQRHYLLQNTGGGSFEDVTRSWAPLLAEESMISDQQWVDWNGDGKMDLVVVGHWEAPRLFLNSGSALEYQVNPSWEALKGLWNCLAVEDVDQDGDHDLLLGNWGLNSKWKVSESEPLRLYRGDFDQNGSVEPLLTYYLQGTETPFSSKDELVKQIPVLNKKFLSYQDFAKASMKDLFGEKALQTAEQKEVNELRSGVLLNNGQQSEFRPWPLLAQSSPVFDLLSEATPQELTIYLVGNHHQISTQLGRLDAQHGLILHLNTQTNKWQVDKSPWTSGAARKIAKLNSKENTLFLVGINNGPLQVFQKDTGE